MRSISYNRYVTAITIPNTEALWHYPFVPNNTPKKTDTLDIVKIRTVINTPMSL